MRIDDNNLINWLNIIFNLLIKLLSSIRIIIFEYFSYYRWHI